MTLSSVVSNWLSFGRKSDDDQEILDKKYLSLSKKKSTCDDTLSCEETISCSSSAYSYGDSVRSSVQVEIEQLHKIYCENVPTIQISATYEQEEDVETATKMPSVEIFQDSDYPHGCLTTPAEIPSSACSREARCGRGFRFPGWEAYNKSLDQHPLRTKALTSLVGWFLGDFVNQVSAHLSSSVPSEKRKKLLLRFRFQLKYPFWRRVGSSF
jgi:hypothetical protein